MNRATADIPAIFPQNDRQLDSLNFPSRLSLSQSLSNFIPGLTLEPAIAAWALLLMIGLGLATGLVPAINAFRLKIADAMGRG